MMIWSVGKNEEEKENEPFDHQLKMQARRVSKPVHKYVITLSSSSNPNA